MAGTSQDVNVSHLPLRNIEDKKQTSNEYPFLFLKFRLEEDYSVFFGQD